jgi:hypothetical protein
MTTYLPKDVQINLDAFIEKLTQENASTVDDKSGRLTRFLSFCNIVDPPNPQWRTDALMRMKAYNDDDIIVRNLYKVFVVIKIVVVVLGIIWLISKLNRNLKETSACPCNEPKPVPQGAPKKNAFDHVYENVNKMLLYGIGCFIIFVAFFLMIRLRRFGPSFFRHSPTVAVFQYWEGTFIWWFLVLLIICSMCAMVPQWNKYMKMFF